MRNSGFTLIELIISLGIISIIISIVLFGQSTYLESTTVTNLVDEVATTVVQAQTYGIAVRELSPGSSNFSASYGISFSILGSGSAYSYLFFADRNNNNIYDGDWNCIQGGLSECLEKKIITRGNLISDVCIIRNDGSENCNESRRADILFRRPNPEPVINIFSTFGTIINDSNRIGVRIKFRSTGGQIRSVSILSSGQVSVN